MPDLVIGSCLPAQYGSHSTQVYGCRIFLCNPYLVRFLEYLGLVVRPLPHGIRNHNQTESELSIVGVGQEHLILTVSHPLVSGSSHNL